MTAVAFAAVLVVLVAQAVQLRRLSDRQAVAENDTAQALAEMRAHGIAVGHELVALWRDSHAHRFGGPVYNHEPAVERLLAGETTRAGGDL